MRKGRRLLLLLPLADLSVVEILLAARTTLVFSAAAVRGRRSQVLDFIMKINIRWKLISVLFYVI